MVERALIQSGGKHLTFDDIAAPSRRSEHPDAEAVAFDNGEVPPDGPAHDSAQARPVHLKLDEVEARHIRQVMEMTGGKIEGKNGAATVLGMNPATLRYRMQKLGIAFGRGKGAAQKGH
jgi:transcriptional regulator with GAF, ATPase, and Fis domain